MDRKKVLAVFPPGTPERLFLFREAHRRGLLEVMQVEELRQMETVLHNSGPPDTEPYIDCPVCGARSHNPRDIANQFCLRCDCYHLDLQNGNRQRLSGPLPKRMNQTIDPIQAQIDLVNINSFPPLAEYHPALETSCTLCLKHFQAGDITVGIPKPPEAPVEGKQYVTVEMELAHSNCVLEALEQAKREREAQTGDAQPA